MTTLGVAIQVPNSVLLVGDPTADCPEAMLGQLVAATSRCVAVGTNSEGVTRVTVTDSAPDRSGHLAFEGNVDIADGVLTISSVLGNPYIEWTAPRSPVRVQIWVNDHNEPDDICVVVT